MGQSVLVCLHDASLAALVELDPFPEAHSSQILPVEGDVERCWRCGQV